jgi:ParB family transcriptional regulator, chromosome partitioning protein
MSSPKRRLGRALSDMGVQALLSEVQSETINDQIQLISLVSITPNTNQPRQTFKQESLDELSESIKTHGVIQPIIVTQKGEVYEIIAGERRFRASQLANLPNIPAIVKNIDELAAESIAIIENIQREELNPMDQARAYARLISTYKLSHDEIAAKVHKSRSAISNMLRLNKLHPEVKQHLQEGRIEMGHARALLAAPDDQQPTYALSTIQKKLSVRQVEQLLKKTKQTPQPTARDTHWIVNTLKQFNLKAKIRGSHEKGSITLQYDSPDALEKLLSSLTSKNTSQITETS